MHAATRETLSSIQTESQACKTYDVKGARIYVASSMPAMGCIAGLHTKLHLLANHTKRTRFDFARAPSQVEAWRSLASKWPDAYKLENAMMFPFDEIRGAEYAKLEQSELRAVLPAGVLPNKVEIDAGDCSKEHAEKEAQRLNLAIDEWIGNDVFSMALAGTSPNASPYEILLPEYDPDAWETHLAFDRSGLEMPDTAFKAIPMSTAASNQQANEGVVASGASIKQDWVVTMTAKHLAKNTDVIVFSIPDNRGVSLWRILHDDPEKLPAALIQRHLGIGKTCEYGDIPKVVICTTEQSWDQYKQAEQYFKQTQRVLGT